ncbi:MAG TPA: hypothetical protein VMC03_16270 [Streptosporangiaceae bacterium]|nr:hypothetical protein [Streptosporangiaceae bacterium]
MPSQARTGERAVRRSARMLIGRNELRRSCDRVEGTMVALLLAAFLVVIAGAFVLGTHIYARQRAEAARLHPSLAVLTQSGPYNTGLNVVGETTARWDAPGGRARSGMLTTVNTPGIWDAKAGQRVQVWLTAAGQPVAPPPGATEVMFTAIVIGFSAACGAGAVLLGGYGLTRLLLDRRRAAAWESAWELTGPQWTPRR